MSKNAVKNKVRLLPFPIMAMISFPVIIFLIAFFIFTVSFEPSRTGLLNQIPVFVLWAIVSCGLGIFTLILAIYHFLVVIQIDETGISRSFFGRYRKLQISWDELADVRYYLWVSEQIVFSKTKKLTNVPMPQVHKIKDRIIMGFSKKRYAVINQYLQQPIVGLPDKVKARLEGKGNEQ